MMKKHGRKLEKQEQILKGHRNEHGGTALRKYYITEDVDWYADRK